MVQRRLLPLMLMVSLVSIGLAGDDALHAAAYPTKPVTLIVAYGAGGGTDVTARLLASSLQRALGQPVIVTNVTGGGGWLGWGRLAQSAPDGYTIGYINVPNMFAGYLDPQIGRKESLESFVTIMNHVTDPGVWIVRPDSPLRSVGDVISSLRQRPGGLVIAAHGYGGDDHLGILQVEKRYGVRFSVIHNDSTAVSISQLLGGHVDIVGANVGEVTSLIRQGEVRALGVAWQERSPFLPEVPTFREQGYDVIYFVGRGIAAPAGTPPDIVGVLTAALERAVADPEHLRRLEELGLQLDTMRGAEYQRFLKENEQMVKDLMGW